MAGATNQFHEMFEPAIKALDLELWGLEFHSQGKRSMLRVYIEGPNGVNVDDCARVSRQLSALLDVEDPIASEYTLEVSSPGVERPLFTLEQYPAFIGEMLNLKLSQPFEGKRKFKGQLVAIEAEEQEVVIREGDEELVFPFEVIEKANLVYQFTKGGK